MIIKYPLSNKFVLHEQITNLSVVDISTFWKLFCTHFNSDSDFSFLDKANTPSEEELETILNGFLLFYNDDDKNKYASFIFRLLQENSKLTNFFAKIFIYINFKIKKNYKTVDVPESTITKYTPKIIEILQDEFDDVDTVDIIQNYYLYLLLRYHVILNKKLVVLDNKYINANFYKKMFYEFNTKNNYKNIGYLNESSLFFNIPDSIFENYSEDEFSTIILENLNLFKEIIVKYSTNSTHNNMSHVLNFFAKHEQIFYDTFLNVSEKIEDNMNVTNIFFNIFIDKDKANKFINIITNNKNNFYNNFYNIFIVNIIKYITFFDNESNKDNLLTFIRTNLKTINAIELNKLFDYTIKTSKLEIKTKKIINNDEFNIINYTHANRSSSLAIDKIFLSVDFKIDNLISKIGFSERRLQFIINNQLKLDEDILFAWFDKASYNNSHLYDDSNIYPETVSSFVNDFKTFPDKEKVNLNYGLKKWNYSYVSTYKWLPIKYIKKKLSKLNWYFIFNFLDKSQLDLLFSLPNFKRNNLKKKIGYKNIEKNEKIVVSKLNNTKFYCLRAEEKDPKCSLCDLCVHKVSKILDINSCGNKGYNFLWEDEVNADN